MDVNFFGLVALTKAFLPLLRRDKGRVINMSSLSAVAAPPLWGMLTAVYLLIIHV
jgi:NAD(P)-dependent dehydrogenase (short-subunit alcohol dehydrogenase family)